MHEQSNKGLALLGKRVSFLYFSSGRMYGTERALSNLLSYFLASGLESAWLVAVKDSSHVHPNRFSSIFNSSASGFLINRLTITSPPLPRLFRLAVILLRSTQELFFLVRRHNVSAVVCLSPYLLPVLAILRIATAGNMILWLHTPISYYPAAVILLVRLASLLSVCKIVVCSRCEVMAIEPAPSLARCCASKTPLFINNFLAHSPQAIDEDDLSSMIL